MLRATSGVLVALALVSASPSVAAERCAGEKVTISFEDPGVGLNIRGTAGDDVIQGGPRAETIQGGRGDDVICGGDGSERISGGPGRDELLGQDGSDRFSGADLALDIVVGGPSSQFLDLADYRKSPAGIRVSMGNGLVLADGAAARGGIQGIEEVLGSGHDDQLIGNDRDQYLFGLEGNDLIDGRAGDDSQVGGPGIDRVTYARADAAVVVDLNTARAKVGQGREADSDRVESFEIVTGSRFDDKITGDDEKAETTGGKNERLEGGPGDDVLKAGHGHDTLQGDAGDDTLFPGPGDDTVDGGANGPVTGTNAPGDLVSYQPDEPTDDLGGSSFEFEAYLAPSPLFPDVPPRSAGVGDDLLIGIESARGPQRAASYIGGDSGPNVLIGGSKYDYLEAGAGNDLLFGLGGEDTVIGDAGDDHLDGGSPSGESDSDLLNAGDGDDTCVGANESFTSGCEALG